MDEFYNSMERRLLQTQKDTLKELEIHLKDSKESFQTYVKSIEDYIKHLKKEILKSGG